jgi:uncharacterized protein (TIGR00661 family)
LGHVSRCVAIAQEVIDQGSSVLFSTYLEGINYVRKHNLPVVESPEIFLENDPTGRIDLKASSRSLGINAIPTFLNQVNAEIKFMKSFEPDLILCDTRLSSIYAAKILKIPIILLINQFLPRVPRTKENSFYRILDGTIMTILGNSWARSNIILIPDFPEPYTISTDSLRIPKRYGNQIRFVGSILSKKPNDVNGKKIREQYDISNDVNLIYAGISGPKPERIPLIKIMGQLLNDLPAQYKAIMSMGFPQGGNKPEFDNSLIKIPWVDDRFEYLKACDLVISRGGHETIMQSISYGKPSLLIPVPNHPEQYGNCRKARELGIAEALHQRDVNLNNLLSSIMRIEEGDHKQKLMEIRDSIPTTDGLQLATLAMKEILG